MARTKENYEHERMFLSLVPQLLMAHGLTAANVRRPGGMKFAEARAADGSLVRFWVKQAWSNQREFAAIQFSPTRAARTDMEFIQQVSQSVANAKATGAQYLLMAHMPEDVILSNYAVLHIDDVVLAYTEQLARWPNLAREGGAPAVYFDDRRSRPEAECASVVRALSVPLSGIAGLQPIIRGTSDPASKKAEVERRLRQEVFRQSVGARYGWTCAVSGNQVHKVLEAAHLPGKDWHFDNEASDGIMLRVDLHRLLDAGLAELRAGRFWIHPKARCEQYAQFHNREYHWP